MPKLTRKKKTDRSPSPALLAAFELHRQGRLDEAEVGYRDVLKEDPANWQGLHQLGEIHLARAICRGVTIPRRHDESKPGFARGRLELRLCAAPSQARR